MSVNAIFCSWTLGKEVYVSITEYIKWLTFESFANNIFHNFAMLATERMDCQS